MSKPTRVIERFDPASHQVADFSCGEESLDRWFHRYAGQSERRDATRTFVAIDGQGAVRGYYTLVAGQLEHVEATEAVRKGLSRHCPIPVAILARLAVGERSQGPGAWPISPQRCLRADMPGCPGGRRQSGRRACAR